MNMHELIGAVDVQALASGWWTSALAGAQRVDAATLLWVAAACWFAAGIVALRAARAAQRRLAHRLARLEELANATSMDVKTLLREGERFQDDRRETLEAVALVRERQDELELHVRGSTAYERAIELAGMGLSPEQLMQTTGLSRGEAELLRRLHHVAAA